LTWFVFSCSCANEVVSSNDKQKMYFIATIMMCCCKNKKAKEKERFSFYIIENRKEGINRKVRMKETFPLIFFQLFLGALSNNKPF
jgi:hypothetical protein